jgi:hypothetical protein
MKASMTFTGGKKLLTMFGKLPERVGSRVLRSAVMSASLVMQKAMAAAAPVDTGTLRDSIDRTAKYYPRSLVAVAVVGPRLQRVAVARPDGSTVIANPGRYVNPVNARNPFVARSFDSSQGKAASKFAKALERGIEREAKRS